MIKVLIIEDSGFMRIMLSDKLGSDKEISIIGTAPNGKEGIHKALDQNPDIIICDLIMPEYNGLRVVEELMKKKPIPIILLSSLDKSDALVFDALNAGAVDFVSKSDVAEQGAGISKLIELIKSTSEINLFNRKRINTNTNEHTFDTESKYQIIAIGASTGGPSTIETIIKNLPANLNVPLIIVQHMPHSFIVSFAARISRYTSMKVKIPLNGEELENNTIYVAPGSSNLKVIRNMTINKPIFRYSNQQYKEFNNPSIDSVFDSVAKIYGKKAIGIVLTGMGKDGTKGLEYIKKSGGYTIAQDESTSVVYGMPKSAMEAGIVDVQLKMNEIPGYVVNCL